MRASNPEKPLHPVKQLLALMSWRHRSRTVLLVVLAVLTASMEMLGIASVAPFLAVLAAPDLIESNRYLSAAYHYLGSESREHFLFLLGAFAFLALVGATGCRALNSWGQIRFNRSLELALACRLMTGYLRRPYVFFLSRNSAELSKMVLSEAAQVVGGFLAPTMTIVSNLFTVTLLLTLLCLVSPIFALAAAAGIGAAYVIIFMLIRRWLLRIGQERFNANQKRYEATNEVFGGIKEIKLLNNEDVYQKRFTGAFSRLARAQARASLAGTLPVYAIEVLTVGGGLIVALSFLGEGNKLAQALPLIALYLLSARRLLPAMQHIFKAVTQLRYSQPAVRRVLADFSEIEQPANQPQSKASRALSFDQALVMENVSFTYPNAVRPAISGANVKIPIGAHVGFVGATGSGKTTTMDLVLGLLEPTAGRLLIDGTPINRDNVRDWQLNLGYVPQHIYLADDTVAANVALGVPRKKINHRAVEQAARLAQIHDFIVEELPLGYLTKVGERGVRLSGGQRQRIGIARALYRAPKVLLFDEATSALDNRTEKSVMQSLQKLGRDRTIIFIAHRLTTVKNCDVIYLFAGGRIVATGTYDELTASNAEFQAMTVDTISSMATG